MRDKNFIKNSAVLFIKCLSACLPAAIILEEIMSIKVIAASLVALTMVGACQTTPETGKSGQYQADASSTKLTGLPANVPLPGDLIVGVPAEAMKPEIARWYGAWSGKWGGQLDSVVIVEQLDADGTGQVVYAWADHIPWNITRGWTREQVTIEGDTMTLDRFQNGAQASFKFRGDGALGGLYERKGRSGSYGTFTRKASE